jgi:hypothetical protein
MAREIFNGRPEPKKLDEAIAKWVNRGGKEPWGPPRARRIAVGAGR